MLKYTDELFLLIVMSCVSSTSIHSNVLCCGLLVPTPRISYKAPPSVCLCFCWERVTSRRSLKWQYLEVCYYQLTKAAGGKYKEKIYILGSIALYTLNNTNFGYDIDKRPRVIYFCSSTKPRVCHQLMDFVMSVQGTFCYGVLVRFLLIHKALWLVLQLSVM